ncbi:4-hydroxy-tetrahydrodipicolinate reductase [Aequorivita antarctica]|uniref:4-hydroxy-tetrahydrodipicolinate reductase n=1 Tax=Aequorivita antarctica TaxID=153266 RepID=A0A5C6YXT1_9FLAO|nr:4-hydroxy-tetrahydrodipicolinate reductase [Aequorivita antarctica]TXD71933.1 4-hydroxy-tetrahydrodipicolinate reductase [Aequorivita antarctica]SRX72969.1 4-hydroxy-tetrahydrodipicolinate reductase [Aequorivita antarctica]
MKIALLGYGKMGKTIEKLALEKGHSIVFKSTSESSEGDFEDAEVAIEFSSPEAAVKNISKALEAEIPIVSGTTGWLGEYSEMVNLCEKRNGSFIYASNFSIGVNLFFSINEYAAKLMAPWKEYNVSVEEIHHLEKKDAPSGTAITIAEGILKHTDKKDWKLNTFAENILNITAKREEDVKGTHIVSYDSDIDTISFKHEAHSREGFALGAILAADWIQNRKGIFTMKDVLGIK